MTFQRVVAAARAVLQVSYALHHWHELSCRGQPSWFLRLQGASRFLRLWELAFQSETSPDAEPSPLSSCIIDVSCVFHVCLLWYLLPASFNLAEVDMWIPHISQQWHVLFPIWWLQRNRPPQHNFATLWFIMCHIGQLELAPTVLVETKDPNSSTLCYSHAYSPDEIIQNQTETMSCWTF